MLVILKYEENDHAGHPAGTPKPIGAGPAITEVIAAAPLLRRRRC
jgi:hypothetical protein